MDKVTPKLTFQFKSLRATLKKPRRETWRQKAGGAPEISRNVFILLGLCIATGSLKWFFLIDWLISDLHPLHFPQLDSVTWLWPHAWPCLSSKTVRPPRSNTATAAQEVLATTAANFQAAEARQLQAEELPFMATFDGHFFWSESTACQCLLFTGMHYFSQCNSSVYYHCMSCFMWISGIQWVKLMNAFCHCCFPTDSVMPVFGILHDPMFPDRIPSVPSTVPRKFPLKSWFYDILWFIHYGTS